MKSKLLKALQIILITVAVLIVCCLVLRMEVVDRKLTEWFGSPLEETTNDHRIIIDGFEDALSVEEAPFVYEEEGRLMVLQGGFMGQPMDITPPDVNIEYYASQHDVTEELRMRKQCAVRADGQQMLFLLVNREIPTLFLTDFTTATTVTVATNVDSFLFVGDAVVYASGYEQSNQLYVFREGKSQLLASDVQSLALPKWNAIVSLDREGYLRIHDVAAGTTELLAEQVEDIYEETAVAVNADQPTVYCRKKNGDYRITQQKEESLSGNYLDEIDILLTTSTDGTREYRFCEAQGIISCVENGSESRLFGELGKIYKVLDINETEEEFVVANGTGLYLARARVSSEKETAATVCLLKFKGDYKIYRNNGAMISAFMGVYREDTNRFYIQSVSGSSFILNSKRPESWLNYFSSYLYGLSYVTLTEDGNQAGQAVACDVRHSRTLTAPLVCEGRLMYLSTFDNGEIRSVAALSQGKVLSEDLLRTHGIAKGQLDILVEVVGGEVYFTLCEWNGTPEYSTLTEDGKDIRGIRKRVVSSFGYAYEWGP